MSEQLGPLLRDAQPLLRRTPPILEAATPLIDQLHKVLSRAADAAPQLEAAIGASRRRRSCFRNPCCP